MSEQQNNTLTRPQAAPTRMIAPDFSAEQIDLIKRLICKGATDDELHLFLHQCRKTGLDPLSRQIYGIKRSEWDDEAGEYIKRLTVQTGIDGYWLVADRTGRCAGAEEAEFGPEFEPEQGVKAPLWARVTVYKLVDGKERPYPHTVRFSEYAAKTKKGKLTRFWRERPYRMLEKCAEAGALRKAFPQELSGVYTQEEMPPAEEEPETGQTPARLPSPAQAAGAPAKPAPAAKPPSMTDQQADRLDQLRLDLGLTVTQLQLWCHKHWSALVPDALTVEQANEAIKRLEDELGRRKAATTAGAPAAPPEEVATTAEQAAPQETTSAS